MKRRRSYKIISLFLCISLCAAMLSGCESWDNFRRAFIDPPEPEAKIIKVGILEPQTGRRSYDAEDEVAGMQLAHELFPKAEGYDIELVYEDNRSNTDICKEAAQKLTDQGCAIILGSVSDTLSLAASDVIQENQIPAIAATCTVPILTKTNPYYLRVNVINSFDAEGAAEYAYKVLDSKAVVVLLPEGDDYARTKAEVFEAAFVRSVGYDTFEYAYTEVDEESGKTTEKTAMSPAVYYMYINGTESEEKMLSTFREMDRMGSYLFYCPCKSDLVLPWMLAASNFEFPVKEPEKPQVPDNLTTMSYWDQNGNWVEEVGYWDQWGNWVKYVPPEETEAPEEPENKFFSWVGTDLWKGIADDAMNLYGTTYMLSNVAYTLSYDATVSQSEMSKAFLEAYHRAYGQEASPSDNFALGFDAYLLAYKAMCSVIQQYDTKQDDEVTEDPLEENQPPRIALFDVNNVFNRTLLTGALYRIKDLEGATGIITMDENGDPTKDIIIEAFDGYEFRAVYTAYPGNLVEPGE